MTGIKLLACALLAGCLALACGGSGKEDPLATELGSTEGRLTLGGNGPNQAVTDLNGLNVAQTMNVAFFAVYTRTVQAMTKDPQVASNLRITGNYSGYAIADGGGVTDTTGGTTQSFSFKLTLFDYSDDGALFFGGALECTGLIVWTGSRGAAKNVFIKDTIVMAGNYKAIADYDHYILPTDSNGNLVSLFDTPGLNQIPNRDGEITFTSNGKTVKVYPYVPKPGGGL